MAMVCFPIAGSLQFFICFQLTTKCGESTIENSRVAMIPSLSLSDYIMYGYEVVAHVSSSGQDIPSFAVRLHNAVVLG